MLGALFLLLAVVEFGVRGLYRWRTWRDRGAISVLITLTLAACLWTKPAAMAYELLGQCAQIPGGTILLPAVCALLGLLGSNPFLCALFLGVVHPDPQLSYLTTLPMCVAHAPHTVFYACTMPPHGERATR